MISLRNRGGVEWVMMKLPYKYHVLITYLMLVAFISFAACTSRDTTTESKLVDHLSLNHQFKVDSIVSIISKDTLSLMNWLRLSGTTNDPYTRAAIYYQLGTYHQNNYSIQRAIDYHNLSLATAKESGNGIQEIRALNALGHDYKLLCTYNKSAEHYFKALVLLGQEKEDQEKGDTKKAQTERIKTLEDLAEKLARTVERTRKSVTLEPMTAYERKIIHTKLQNNSKVKTFSKGEEPYRKVVISLK